MSGRHVRPDRWQLLVLFIAGATVLAAGLLVATASAAASGWGRALQQGDVPGPVSTGGMWLARMDVTHEPVASSLPVRSWSGKGYSVLLRVVTGPLEPGDVLDVSARARVTDDLGYTVGVGYHLAGFVLDESGHQGGDWFRLGTHLGDNVDAVRHHMPLVIPEVWVVPPSWPSGARAAVALRADAASTRWQRGDRIAVDGGYGLLVVRQLRGVS